MAVRLLDERDISSFNKNFSNALVGDLRGAIVVADDVSPCEHEMAVKVWSKNLIPFPYNQSSKTVNGVTITVNGDGSISLNGTSTGAIGFPLFIGEMKLKGEYTLSGVTNTGEGESTHYLQPYVDGQFLTIVANGSRTYTIDGNLTQLSLFVKAGYTFDNVVVYPMFEAGEIASEYIPYVDPASVKVKRCGKNLFDTTKYKTRSSTVNGVTVDMLDDGCIYVHGTPIDSSNATSITLMHYQEVDVLPKGTYVYSNNPSKNNDNILCFPQANKPNNGAWIVNLLDTETVVPEEFCVNRFVVYIKAGVTEAIDIKYYIQVEAGEESTDYEPYREAFVYIPESDGTVKGITSFAPNMTIFTETAGTIVECEYSKDVGAVIEKLTNAIVALGGSV